MKYSAEVDSEKRNRSPRNDLLRKRKCVGIIQAAKSAHTRTHTQARLRYLQRRRSGSDRSRCERSAGGPGAERAEQGGRSAAAAAARKPGD